MARVNRCLMFLLHVFALVLTPWDPFNSGVQSSSLDEGLLVITIATDPNDGLRRYLRSVKKYDLDAKVFGLGEKWDGGDIANYAGGGHKINILKKELLKYKDDKDLVLMFTDSYDVVFTNGAKEILKTFKKMNARVVFSAEDFCWPDSSLAEQYPTVKMHEKRFLNSGGYIGYAADIYALMSSSEIGNRDDDQLFFTKLYLDEGMREKHQIKLDTKGEIFQNLNGALDEVTIKFKGERSFLYNVKTGTQPVVAHGNGPIKTKFNRIANYLADSWTPTNGCASCKEDTINLKDFKEEDLPNVFIAVFIDHPVPFMREFFQNIVQQKYPQSKIDLYIHNRENFHLKDVEIFEKAQKTKYNSFTVYGPERNYNQWSARNHAIEECLKRNCQYYLALDPEAQLTNHETLRLLIEQNRSVIAPLIQRKGKMWSNFWGALASSGFYARSEDYLDIVQGNKVGLWNVPYINAALLIHGSVLKDLRKGYINENFDPDMALCKSIREQNAFLFVSNTHYYGHLVDSDNYDTSHLHNELYEIFNNPHDWEQRYIHENYSRNLVPETKVLMPCPDVYWFPITTETFCEEFIAEMENYGQWSNGQNDDPRLAGGYENVPTRDIHMNQVGLEKQWLHFLKKYVSPVQEKVFPGYYSNPLHSLMNFIVRYRPDEQPSLRPHHDSSTYTINLALNRPNIDYEVMSLMNFIVRYRPDEQPSLRPHHDSSTFTINLALNEPGVDYEGGGCRFLRYDCAVKDMRRGWMLMHPGRLTHYHEGLRTTAGTRYIMISFIDP